MHRLKNVRLCFAAMLAQVQPGLHERPRRLKKFQQCFVWRNHDHNQYGDLGGARTHDDKVLKTLALTAELRDRDHGILPISCIQVKPNFC